MSKKSEVVLKVLSKIELRWPLPAPLEGADLVEQGLHAVLMRRLDAKSAARCVESLRTAFGDWNELRVAQSQEIARVLPAGARSVAAAGDVRAYLQEVFQRSHGMTLEFLRDDPEASKRFTSILPFIGMGTAHYLLWLAADGELPVTSALTRVLDRMGLVARMTNVKKARAAIGPLVPTGKQLEFVIKIGEVASRWCDPKKPLCHQCPAVEECKYGKKAFREWRIQQERMEVQRKREEARLALLRKKEEARRAREEARARKQAEADAKKRARELERRSRVEARKKAAEEQRLAAQRAREQAKRKREEERQRKKAEAEAARKARQEEAARKAAEAKAKAKAEAARKAAAKKATGKKTTGKKAAARKAKPAARKAVRKTSPKPAQKAAPKKRAPRKARARKA